MEYTVAGFFLGGPQLPLISASNVRSAQLRAGAIWRNFLCPKRPKTAIFSRFRPFLHMITQQQVTQSQNM